MATNIDCTALQNSIREKYVAVSRSIDGKFRYPTGREGAKALKYDSGLIASAPAELIKLFCGVGNPFSLGEITPGQTILDVGCGAGFDLYCSSKLVGLKGKVFGIDLTPEMVESARKNLVLAGVSNAKVQVASSESIPFEDNSFDVVTSNGVLNLSPDKERSFCEIYRVLKPGGRFQFADMVLQEELPLEDISAKAWSDSIGGAIPVRDLVNMMRNVGFYEVEFMGTTGFSSSKYTVGATFRAIKPEKFVNKADEIP